MSKCDHDPRFSGVFDLPKSDGGCLACALERESCEVTILQRRLDLAFDMMKDHGIDNAAVMAKIQDVIDSVSEGQRKCPKCGDEYSGAFCPCSYEVQDDERV